MKHLVISDQHAHPDHNNKRADWLGQLIVDTKPDVVINIGDSADLASLATYDKGTRGYVGKTYRKDIDAHLDFQERLWSPVKKAKKRLPKRIYLIGNHEYRIERALDLSPELTGTISMDDLDLERYYDIVVPYNGKTPGVHTEDGIAYAHYFISGTMGRAIGGEHPAYSLLVKQFMSCTQGHSHVADFCVRTDGLGKKIMGAHVGVYQDYDSDWAGEVNHLWWRGVLLKNNVEKGIYDPQFISLDSIKKTYK